MLFRTLFAQNKIKLIINIKNLGSNNCILLPSPNIGVQYLELSVNFKNCGPIFLLNFYSKMNVHYLYFIFNSKKIFIFSKRWTNPRNMTWIELLQFNLFLWTVPLKALIVCRDRRGEDKSGMSGNLTIIIYQLNQ